MIKRWAALLVCFFTLTVQANVKPLAVAPTFERSRYLGQWYEIASLPNFFQKGCACSRAIYTPKGRKIGVYNHCIRHGKVSDIKGVAWSPDQQQPAKLKVRFFWPFRVDYWILYVSPDYQYALVGLPNRKYLWVLSRKKTMPNATYRRILNIAKQQGFVTSQVKKTSQDC